jgi:hypothetical protein
MSQNEPARTNVRATTGAKKLLDVTGAASGKKIGLNRHSTTLFQTCHVGRQKGTLN